MKKNDRSKIALANLLLLAVCLVSTAFSLGMFANLLLSIELVPSAYAEQKTTTTSIVNLDLPVRHPTINRKLNEVRGYVQSRTSDNRTDHEAAEPQDSGSPSAVQNAAELIKQHKAKGN